MYIPNDNRPKVLLPFTGCDEKKCPWKDCVRHPDSGYSYNSMAHLSYICQKYKEKPKEIEEELKEPEEEQEEKEEKENVKDSDSENNS